MLLLNLEMTIFLLLLLGLANTATGQTVRCPGSYHAIGNGCYLFPAINESSWITAHLFCEFSGGYLVNINSATEQMDLYTYHYQYIRNATTAYLIGATDLLANGTWRWAPSGATLDYSNWGPNGPIPTPGSDCAYWLTITNWVTHDCCTVDQPYYPLCEADPL